MLQFGETARKSGGLIGAPDGWPRRPKHRHTGLTQFISEPDSSGPERVS